MKKVDYLKILFLVLIIIIPIMFSAQSQNPPKKNILILHSYHKGYEWTDSIHQGIMENLDNIENYNIRVEYLDAINNPSVE